jgi:hypothetical protein
MVLIIPFPWMVIVLFPNHVDAPPNFLKDSNANIKMKTTKERVRVRSQHFGGKRGMLELRDAGLRQITNESIIHINLHKPNNKLVNVPTLLWGSVKMKLTLSKLGLGNPLGLPKFQSSIAGVKTLCIGIFFISLKKYWSVDAENGLAWAIWTSIAQVMAKRRVRSQTDSLTPDH